MTEPVQLYDKRAKPLAGKGAAKEEVFKKGLLHGASHVWIWRKSDRGMKILVQKRASNKSTWPNMLDISAAGKVDLGEMPIETAVRETKEELGLDIKAPELSYVGVYYLRSMDPGDNIVNEFKWLYVYELKNNRQLSLQASEVQSVEWVDFNKFKKEIFDDSRYVPHGHEYYKALISYLEQLVP
ncbi:MAG TPA: NUDIX domain-containing protein [Patescibacteria group bacterium]|nr:NUDIX domain-containing protein [Patescibacteria group bacterium]